LVLGEDSQGLPGELSEVARVCSALVRTKGKIKNPRCWVLRSSIQGRVLKNPEGFRKGDVWARKSKNITAAFV
jgi:hypothetical protein